MQQKYKIRVGRDIKELERVFNILFSFGYVFPRSNRFRTFEKIKELWPDSMREWLYITHGDDEECKMVLCVICNDIFDAYQTITVEEFLKIKGHTVALMVMKKEPITNECQLNQQ